MIKVGINSDVKLKSTSLNEKGTLVFSLTSGAQQASSTPVDDVLNNIAGVTDGDGSTKIMLFAPSVEYMGEKRKVADIASDLGGFRDQLQHILQGYMTSDKAQLDPYVGVETSNAEELQVALTNQNTIDRIYNNLAAQFIEKFNALDDASRNEAFRVLLVRRSKASHYGTFRKRFISNNPFWESMKIPVASSALAFNKYEIKNKLNDGTPVASDDATDTSTAGPSASDAVSDLLGSR